MMEGFWTLLLVAMTCSTVVNGQNLAKHTCSVKENYIEHEYDDADVVLISTTSIRYSGTGGIGCGSVIPGMIQHLEAMRLAIDNANDQINVGVKFGLKFYDPCSSPINALRDIQKLLPQTTSYKPYCAQVQPHKIMLGIVGGYFSTVSLPVAEYINEIPITMISPYSESSALSDTDRFPNFFRTTPSNFYKSRALAALANELNWKKLIMIYLDEAWSSNYFNEMVENVQQYSICVKLAIKLPMKGTVAEYKQILEGIGSNSFVAGYILAYTSNTKMILQAIQQIDKLKSIQWIVTYPVLDDPSLKQMRGVITMNEKTPIVGEFADYFVDLLSSPSNVVGNPLFKQWYEQEYGCSLSPGTANECILKDKAVLTDEFQEASYVISTMNAVWSYAYAVKNLCPGGGVCQALKEATPQQIQNSLKGLNQPVGHGFSIRFSGSGDIGSSLYTFKQYTNVGGTYSLQSVGEFINGQVTMTSPLQFYDADRENILTQVPTDGCGNEGCSSCIMPPSRVNYQYTSGDIVIGSLVNGHRMEGSLFTCGSGIESKLATMAAVQWAVEEYKRRNPLKLRGVSFGSLVADVCPTGAVAADFLNNLLSSTNIVDEKGIAISARKNIYGFVDDTDNMMATAISNILSQYKMPEIQAGATRSSIHSGDMHPYFARIIPDEEMYFNALTDFLVVKYWQHVQILTIKDTWYEQMADRFKAHAARKGICVVSISYITEGPGDVLTHLLSDPESFVVVTFGDAPHVKPLFDQIKTSGKRGKIQVVSGVPEWSTDPNYFDLTSSEPEYTITLGLKLRKNRDFETYLSGLSQNAIGDNPFLASLFEETNQCALLSGSHGRFSRSCSPTESFTPYQGNAPYVIQAIYNMADKLHDIIADVCQDANYNGLCVKFQQTSDIPQRLADKLKQSTLIKDGEGTSDIIYYVVLGGMYTQFGSYDTASHQVDLVFDHKKLLNPSSKSTTCPGFCHECQYLYSYKDIIYRPGDFLIAGSFGVSSSGPAGLQPFLCGDINVRDGPQFTMAMSYALDQVLNNKAPVSVNGLTIGGLALDHCGTNGRSKMMLSDIYSGFLNPTIDIDESKILSWIIDGSGSTRESATVLDPLGIPMVSSDATSEALLKDYDNFYRTIQGDSTTAKFFVKMAKQLGFGYMQVVHDSSAYGHDYKDTLMTAAEAEGVCIKHSYELSDPPQASNIVQELTKNDANVVILIMGSTDILAMFDAIVLDNKASSSLLVMTPEAFTDIINFNGRQMTFPPISLQFQSSLPASYKAYIDSNPVSNIFFAKLYMKVFQCNLKGYHLYATACSYPLNSINENGQFSTSEFDLATINAVYASVDALDRTLKDYCGQDYSSPCAAFKEASDRHERYVKNLNSVSFIDEGGNTFRFLQREGNVAFNILQFSKTENKQLEVGVFAGVSLDLDENFAKTYKDVVSTCEQPCGECMNKGFNFSLTPGDIYLGGLFDVHQTTFNPFLCGRIKTLHGFLLVEAFHYALSQVNAKEGQFKDILNGVKLGGVGLDACTSQVRGGQLVSNIENGLTRLTKGTVTVEAPTIDTWIGSYYSRSSRYLARILTDVGLPQISYAAGSTDLSDQRLYPYFYRTVPSSIHQARAILAYLNEQDIRYIQVLYAGTSYGEGGKDELLKLASEYKVCVAQTVEYPDLGIASPGQSKAVVASLMEKPAANLVVTFLGTDFINSVLRAVGLSDKARNKLRFLGSDIWADNKDAIEGATQYALDSVTLKLDADDVVQFENHIDSKTLVNSDENPWFEEYYQEIHNCYTSPINKLGYSRQCASISSIISSSRYQQDPDVLNVINAVYASAFAIHKTVKDLCGDGYQSVCEAYRKDIGRHNGIRDNLATVEFKDPTEAMFKFVDREAQLNFRLNAIVSGGRQGIYYQQIGSYNTSSQTVSLSSSYKPSRPWEGGCDRPDACAECPAIRDSTKRYNFYSHTNPIYGMAPVIVIFLDLHDQGVDPYRCGKLNMAGFQQFLALRTHANIPELQGAVGVGSYRGIQVLFLDTCSNPVRVDQDLFGLLQGSGLCNTQFVMPDGVSISASNIGSVITSGDMNTMAASRLLEHLKVTYLSPNAMSPMLDSKMFLARTISPVSGKMKFLASLMTEMEWYYMDVVYEESAEGYYPWHSFEQFATKEGLCLASPLTVGVGTNDLDIEVILNQLNGKTGSRVVVLFGGKDFYRRVLMAASRGDIVDDYIWILASDNEIDMDFIKSISPSNDDIDIISLQRINHALMEFKKSVGEMLYGTFGDFNNNKQIPNELFSKFYQMMNDCSMDDDDNDKPKCTSGYVKTDNLVVGDHLLNFVIALDSAAKGLHDFIEAEPTRAYKGKLDSVANRMEINEKILSVTANLKTKGLTENDTLFEFNQNYRWWDSNYLVHYWRVHDKMVEGLNLDVMKARLNISSVCQESEREGFCGCDVETALKAKVVVAPDFIPSNHRNYYKYDDDGERIYDWPMWAIVVAVLTSVGLLIAIFLFLILLCAYPKKGGTSILGYMMIVGVIGIYGINFAFFVSATDDSCLARRFLMGIVYTICFAPLLIKAVDNWRYGHVDHSERRYSGISSACALLMSAIAVVLIQCIIPIMWLILVHPTASSWPYGNTDHHDHDWCDPADDYDLGLVLSFSFVLFVVLLTGIFSALSYHTQTNSNESRWIMFGSVATAGCFLVWMIVTTNAGPIYRDPAVTIGNFVNATILLLAIPLRKTVIMIQAKRNKDYKEEVHHNGESHYETYSESYVNPGYELSDYDHVYMDKPSEF